MATDPRPDLDDAVRVEHQGARGTARRERHGWEVELAAGSGRLDLAAASALLGALVEAIGAEGGGPVRWRVPSPTAEHGRAARTAGFDGSRTLVQLRRPLPTPPPEPPIEVRPFAPGLDETEWLRVNNAAFSWHPEQGGWTIDDLQRRLDEPWFDAAGFLLHPRHPGEGPGAAIDAFCWTKVHREIEPPLGEIFVIAVDPEHAVRGLGRRIVLAGLAHLHGAGIDEAMLYTESDNVAARRLYDALDFDVHHEVRVFERQVPGQTPTPTTEPMP